MPNVCNLRPQAQTDLFLASMTSLTYPQMIIEAMVPVMLSSVTKLWPGLCLSAAKFRRMHTQMMLLIVSFVRFHELLFCNSRFSEGPALLPFTNGCS